jgi:mRNA interferase MazF
VSLIPIPRRGDLVWVDFVPSAGHEQSGRRPALIISPENYNRKTGLAVACPVTTRAKGYPFEVPLPEELPVRGVVLSDHVRTIDWHARHSERIGKVDEVTLAEVWGKLSALIGNE